MNLDDLYPTRPTTEQETEERIASWELKVIARSECGLCDDDGYRPNRLVCDHVNRFKTHTVGMRKVRRALSKIHPVQENS